MYDTPDRNNEADGFDVMADFRPGDVVDHIEGWEGVGRHALPVIERVNSTEFPDDPVAFFVGGGFWRTSRLVVVERAGNPPERVESDSSK